MKIYFHKNFEKKIKKLDRKIKKQFCSRLILFEKNPFAPQLNNHALKGKFVGYRSINITGDFRAIFKQLDRDSIEFSTIDTHGNLYL